MSTRITTIICDACDEVLDEIAVVEGQRLKQQVINDLLHAHACKEAV